MAGFVYFIGSAELDEQIIKIGYTSNHPAVRMAELQTGCPFALDVIAYAHGTRQDERHLHQRFQAFSKTGEWFYLDGFLQAYVADLATNSPPRQPAPTLWTELYRREVAGS